MKNIALKLCIIIIAITSSVACKSDAEIAEEKNSKFRQAFMKQTEIGVVVGDKMIKSYNEEEDQIVIDNEKTLFVVSNQDYTSQYTLEFDGKLYLDYSLNVKFSTSNIKELGNGNTEMKVIKVSSSDLRYWLWSNELSIGFIVDYKL